MLYETWDGGTYVQSATTYEVNQFGENTAIRHLGYTSNGGMTVDDPAQVLRIGLAYAPDTASYIVNNPVDIAYRDGENAVIKRFNLEYSARGNPKQVNQTEPTIGT